MVFRTTQAGFSLKKHGASSEKRGRRIQQDRKIPDGKLCLATHFFVGSQSLGDV